METNVMTVEKLRKIWDNLPQAPRWDGTILENPNLQITKSREKTFKECWFSWPWKPWDNLIIWSEPDPDCYEVPYPKLIIGDSFSRLYNDSSTMLVAHPATATKIRNSVRSIHG